MEQDNIKDSPFYVKYNGEGKDKSFNMPEDMLKALKKHLEDKYADEVEKDGKFKFGKYIRKTLADYLQQQCLERKIFDKSIFAIVSEDKLKSEDDPIIDVCFATTPVFYKEKKRYELSNYQVVRHKLSEFDYELMMWTPKLEHKFLKELRDYKESYSSDNIVVLEIHLNNYLDWYHDGICSDNTNPNVHVGANFISTSVGIFGIFYHWRVLGDYSVDVIDIRVCNQGLLLHMLEQCGNKQIYSLYSDIFRISNKKFPKLEVDMLKEQLNTKLIEKSEIEDEIADLEKKINELDNE